MHDGLISQEDKMVPLSASRIKTAQACSWLYWCKYKLKLPEKGNDGAKRGSICHLLFEVLGDARRKKYYNKIIKTQDIFSVPSIKRLVMKLAKKEGVNDEENISLIKEMTFNGLSYDFFGVDCGKPTKAFSEKEFLIEENNGSVKYKIRGFIDKLFLYKKRKYALIRDFKTSKEVFKGKDLEDNLQDLMYSLAVHHLFPEYKNKQSEFLFLKFELDDEKTNTLVQTQLFDGDELLGSFNDHHIESGVVRMTPVTNEELEGFKIQLTEIQKYLDSFSEKTALSSLASKKPFPKDGSFSGRLLCGFAKEKGQLKKDGNPMWHCPMKFDFYYYLIKDSEGRIVKSVFEEEFSKEMVPKGFFYELKYYPGCPSFKR